MEAIDMVNSICIKDQWFFVIYNGVILNSLKYDKGHNDR